MTTDAKQMGVVLHHDLREPGAFDATGSELHVWLCDLDVVFPKLIAPQAALSVQELARANRLRSSILKERFLRSRQVLRTLLAVSLDLAPEEIELQFGPCGKPVVANQTPSSNRSGLHFGLAHAEQWLAVALAWGNELGVDLEIIRPHVDPIRLAETNFSPREAAELKQLPAHVQRERFYQLWTLKEAAAKAQGTGFDSMQLPEFAFRSGDLLWSREIRLGNDKVYLALACKSSAKQQKPPTTCGTN